MKCRINASLLAFILSKNSHGCAGQIGTGQPLNRSAVEPAAIRNTTISRQDTFKFLARDIGSKTSGFVGPLYCAGLCGTRHGIAQRTANDGL
jgi:hypothetical protein